MVPNIFSLLILNKFFIVSGPQVFLDRALESDLDDDMKLEIKNYLNS